MFTSLASLTAGLLLVSQQAHAGPLNARQDAPPPDNSGLPIREYMDASIVKFLQSQNVDPKYYVPIPGGKNIDWIGDEGIKNEGQANTGILDVADKIRSTNKSAPIIYFNNEYVTFLKRAQNATGGIDNSTDKELNSSADAQKKACIIDFPKAVTSAIKGYTTFGGKLNGTAMTDQEFITWAQGNDDTFNLANSKCQDARTKFVEDTTRLKGDNYALLASAIENIRPFTLIMQSVTPGITMKYNTSGTDVKVPSAGAGGKAFAPLYNLTELTGLMLSWKEQADGMNDNPQFKFDSSEDHTSEIIHNKESGSTIGFDWSAFSVEQENSSKDEEKTMNATATKFSISYGALMLIDISYGAWFDGFRVASAIASSSDDQSKKMMPVFEKFFGKDKDHPGRAALYNSKVLVGYKPSFSMTLKDEDAYDKLTDKSSNTKACFLSFCVGQNHKNHDEVHTTDKKEKSISYKDDQGHILGVITANYWDSTSV